MLEPASHWTEMCAGDRHCDPCVQSPATPLSSSSKEWQRWCRHRRHFSQESRATENPGTVPPWASNSRLIKALLTYPGPKHLRGRGCTALCCPFPQPFLCHLYSQRKGRWVLFRPQPHSALSRQPLQDLLLGAATLASSCCQTAVCKAPCNPQASSLPVQLQMLPPAHGSADMPRAGRMSLAALTCSGPLSFGLSKVGVVRAPHCQCSGM